RSSPDLGACRSAPFRAFFTLVEPGWPPHPRPLSHWGRGEMERRLSRDVNRCRRTEARPPVVGLGELLREKQLLLLLDNFEQVLAAAPPIADLLASCPRLKVLVTSRAVLHLRGEHEVAVAPLALPDRGRPRSVEDLAQYSAVALW